MDKIINAAIELGKLIQEDDRFITYALAKQAQDENEEFQAKMRLFEDKRTQLTREVQAENKDPEKLKRLDKELKQLYNEILSDNGYVLLEKAQEEMQKLLNGVTQIVNGSAAGEKPEDIDYNAACSSEGCASCSGC